MKTVWIILIALAMATFGFRASAGESVDEPPDKPEGFGATSQGGRGGQVLTVTSLADSGPGSLREALAAREARIIRFGVGGVIELRSPLRVTHGRVTIDGATAPGSGITLLNHGLHFVGDCADIIPAAKPGHQPLPRSFKRAKISGTLHLIRRSDMRENNPQRFPHSFTPELSVVSPKFRPAPAPLCRFSRLERSRPLRHVHFSID